MRKFRLWILLAVLCLLVASLPVLASAAGWEEHDGEMYYYLENGDPAQDFLQIDGTWYYFSDARVLKDSVVWSEDYQAYYVLSPDGKQHKRLNNGWTQAYGEWYYMEDGAPAWEEVLKIGGKYYAFDMDCRMVDDALIWVDGSFRAAKKGGELYTNAWYQDTYGDWFYFDAEAYGPSDFLQVNGTWYFFDGGYMICDQAVYSDDYKACYALSPNGESHTRLNIGWTQAYGAWYYVDGSDPYYPGGYPVYDDTMQIGGKWYYFHSSGKMAASERVYATVDDKEGYYIANAEGVLNDTGWSQEGGYWYYLKEGSECSNGIFEIDGNLYAFDWDGRLYTVGGEQEVEYYDEGYGYGYVEVYITDGSGVLYRNRWRERKIESPYEIGWVYYDENGALVENEIKEINGKLYAFDDFGVMETDTILARYDEGIYIVDGSGVATKMKPNTWYQDKASDDWYRTDGDGYPQEDIAQINGRYYGFYNGRMATETYYYGSINGNYAFYLFDAEGELVTAKGWVKVAGEWYYVQADGSLMSGWLEEGGVKYNLWPEMRYDCLFTDYETGVIWYANGKGYCTEVDVKEGFNVLFGEMFYVEGGNLVKNTWKQIDGYWYYFDYSGEAATGYWDIGEEHYLFDRDGRMQTGWISRYGDWYYAKADGALVTGLQTIGGKQYIFHYDGWMYTGDLCEFDGTYYLLDNSGAVKHTFSGTGWVQVGGNWYYTMEGEPFRYTVRKINGKCYGFDDNGVMLSGGLHRTYYDRYYFADSGEILTGWHLVNGKWIYAKPGSSDPYLYTGYWFINDKEYIFDHDGYLMIGSFTYDGYLYTTDADGAVTSSVAAADGWWYYGGNWYYTVDGNGVNGWVGDFFCEYGNMLYDEIVEYNGMLYYLKPDGSLLRNGWYESFYGGWRLARADGSLYCSEWALSGGNWYYFHGTHMMTGYYEIDGVVHSFDENGIWKGEAQFEYDDYEVNAPVGLADGTWYQNKSTGKWYYYHNGEPVTGSLYINGKYYFFRYTDAAMVANNFGVVEYADGDLYLEDRHYYGADGAAVEYTGWQYLKGQWYFFGADHKVRVDTLLRDSSGYYYAYWDYEDGYTMLKNTASVIDGSLYFFDASGLARSAVTKDGWYQDGKDWYYIKDGAPAQGFMKVNGVGYYFYDGLMLTNSIQYANDGVYYFNKDGAMVTRKGWYELYDGIWTYVCEDGTVYEYGIYFIDGVQYSFSNGIWVS